MATEHMLRMGDGKRIFLTKEQILADLKDGMADAVDLGEYPGT